MSHDTSPWRRRAVIRALAAGGTLAVLGAAARADQHAFTTHGGVALSGYDPVAYFTEGRAQRGARRYRVHWKGAEWRFASLAHRDMFESNPWAFAPRYGGYCAFAMSGGWLSNGDPTAWRIENGHLYLMASKPLRDQWLKDVPGHVASADTYWPHILRDR